ncbi:MAG: hypothetical protein GXO81_13875 [Chlorobi bacterium]|nr:hypothetical protein [Chlorobiota bacterium]
MQPGNLKYKVNYLCLFIFSLSMGLLEAIVVVYLRESYYPEGFQFPLKLLPERLVYIEIIREVCTITMIGAVAFLAGKTKLQRLSCFLFTFGVWDIFYYLGLKVFLNWPETLLTWDILFFIPIIWTGPVLAPLICSVIMILMALLFEQSEARGRLESLRWAELLLVFAGAVAIYTSFSYDIGMLIIRGKYLSRLFTLAGDPEFQRALASYVPVQFQWELFGFGILLILIGAGLVLKRVVKAKV